MTRARFGAGKKPGRTLRKQTIINARIDKISEREESSHDGKDEHQGRRPEHGLGWLTTQQPQGIRRLQLEKITTAGSADSDQTLFAGTGRCLCRPHAALEDFLHKTRRAATLVMLQLPTPAREPAAWTHAPSQPLTQSPLSRYQTPAVARTTVGFFGFGSSCGSPQRTDHPAYFGLATYQEARPFSHRRRLP